MCDIIRTDKVEWEQGSSYSQGFFARSWFMQVRSRGVAGEAFRPMALTVEVRDPFDNVLSELGKSRDIEVTKGAKMVMENSIEGDVGFKHHFLVTTPRDLGAVVVFGDSDMHVSSLWETASLAHNQGLSTFEPYLVAHFVHQHQHDEDIFQKEGVRFCFATRPIAIGREKKKHIIRVQRPSVVLFIGTIHVGEHVDYMIGADAPIVFLKETWPLRD
jgi:hypothetical protein